MLNTIKRIFRKRPEVHALISYSASALRREAFMQGHLDGISGRPNSNPYKLEVERIGWQEGYEMGEKCRPRPAGGHTPAAEAARENG